MWSHDLATHLRPHAPEGDLAVPRGPGVAELAAWSCLTEPEVDRRAWDFILRSALPGTVPDSTPSANGVPSLGEAFDTRFQGLEPLGEGATARVYKAFDSRLQRWVALKILKDLGPAHRDRVLAEARAQAQVDHPHVCKVLEIAEREGQALIVLQLAEGPSLVEAMGTMDLNRKLQVAIQVAEGVHAAHLRGLIHLDLKPGNILMQVGPGDRALAGHQVGKPGERRGREATRRSPGVQESYEGAYPLVADFGMVLDPAITQNSCSLGTPPFASPEQLTCDPQQISPRSDVYALGMTLYVMLAGRFPFQASGYAELLEATAHQAPLPLKKVLPDLPEDVDRVVMKALARLPQDRYGSAWDLAEDLRRVLAKRPITARAPSLSYRLLRWHQRNRTLSWALVVGLGLSAGTGLVLGRQVLHERRQQAWANQFEQDVQALDRFLFEAYSLPLHDLRPELEQIRRGIQRIQRDMETGGPAAKGPGHHAQGQLFDLLGEAPKALEQYALAWEGGYRPSSLAQRRAKRMLEDYQERTHLVDIIPDPGLQAAHRDRIRRNLFEPAMTLLRNAQGQVPATLAWEAEVLLLQGQGAYDEAVALAEAQRKERPGNLRLWAQEGRVRCQRAWLRIRPYALASKSSAPLPLPDLESEIRSLEGLTQSLLSRAPSWPEVYHLAKQHWEFRAWLPASPANQAGLKGTLSLLEKAEALNPEHPMVLEWRLGLLMTHYQEVTQAGMDGSWILEKAKRHFQRFQATGRVTVEDIPWVLRELQNGLPYGKVDPAVLQRACSLVQEPIRLEDDLDRGSRAIWLLHLADAIAPLLQDAGLDPHPLHAMLPTLAKTAASIAPPEKLAPLMARGALTRVESQEKPGQAFWEAMKEAERWLRYLPEDQPLQALLRSRHQRLGFQANGRFPPDWLTVGNLLQKFLEDKSNRWTTHRLWMELGERQLLEATGPAQSDRLAASEIAFKRALEVFPESKAAPLSLAECCLRRSEGAHLGTHDLRQGLAWIAQARTYRNPEHPPRLIPPPGFEIPQRVKTERIQAALRRALKEASEISIQGLGPPRKASLRSQVPRGSAESDAQR